MPDHVQLTIERHKAKAKRATNRNRKLAAKRRNVRD